MRRRRRRRGRKEKEEEEEEEEKKEEYEEEKKQEGKYLVIFGKKSTLTFVSAFLTIGVISPLGVATATLTSTLWYLERGRHTGSDNH